MCAESREKPTRPVPIGQWAALVVSFPFPSVKISNMAATVTALPTLLNVSNIKGKKKNLKKKSIPIFLDSRIIFEFIYFIILK